MNDCLRTNVFVRYSPETIACACIYLSARVLGVSHSLIQQLKQFVVMDVWITAIEAKKHDQLSK